LPAAAQPAANPPTAGPPLPSMADLKAMYDAGHYRTALQQAARASALTGERAAAYDKAALALFRADCLLALRETDEAVRWYGKASESPDPKVGAAGRAGVSLVRASPGGTYAPRSNPSAVPLDIAKPDARRQAMADLAAEELKAVKPKADAAARGNSLAPMVEVAPHLFEAYALEVTATGKADGAGPVLTALRERALALIEGALADEERRVKLIEDRANQLVATPPGPFWWQNNSVSRLGLSGNDRRDLRANIAYAEQIESFCARARQAATELGRDPAPWEAALAKAQTTRRHAETVLELE
ncbi:MAG TPA: hypothetical protein VF796_15345, partial [Humisphaera sp.]